ncbi:hypothetical protein P7G91_01240 [Enterococcus faecalis]|uniref:YczE/YyaS/YitT family protein n=1 Tax=Enterococcus faecalis TaxID=1351 RepID=UPI00288D34C3|nr:hypothetical protein [Enterococcus faecalis]MDT2139087.1 hypothetical protein [Enterococcus faecalis]
MKLVKNVLLILIGLVIIGIGASTLRVAGLGVDPFTAMNIGLSSMFGMQLGIFQIIVNAFILFYVYLKNKKAIGLGTILNMLLVGILIQQISTWLQPYADSLGGSTIGKLLSLFVGVLIFTFGCALYMATDQGEFPYDAIAPTICQQTNKPYASVRKAQDLLVLLIGFIAGGPIGIGTIICAFGAGPLISFWNKLLQPLVK